MSQSNPYAPKTETKTEEPARVEAPAEETYEVPEGSIKTVLAWVGNDPAKAKAAFDAEIEGKDRESLLDQLKELF